MGLQQELQPLLPSQSPHRQKLISILGANPFLDAVNEAREAASAWDRDLNHMQHKES
jgi:hypothetical protein